MARTKRSATEMAGAEPVAGNGLLGRRLFLKQGMALVGASSLATVSAMAEAAEPPDTPPGMQSPGAGMSS